MNNEIDDKETMSKPKSKKTVKKATKKKVAPKPDVKPPSQVSVQQFEELEGKFLLVKVGNNERPATNDDIADIESKLVGLLEANKVSCLAFVTHHAVEIEIIENLK